MNIQEESSTFKDMEAKENVLFLAVLSSPAHKKFFIDVLLKLYKGNEKLFNQLTQNLIEKEDLSAGWELLKLTDPVKEWYKLSFQLIKNGISTDSDVLKEFEAIIKDDNYQSWRDRIAKSYQELIQAKNTFAVTNMGLIYSVVNGLKINKQLNISKEDLAQEGYFGLMRAIEKFDHARGLKFSTYAVWWIKHSCQRFIYDKCAVIRTPAHTFEVREKIFEFENAFEKEHGKKPTDTEIQTGTGYSKLTLKTIVKPFYMVNIFDANGSSSDEEDDGFNLLDKLVCDQDETPLDRIESGQTNEVIHQALGSLSEREQKILHNRFGFNDLDEQSLQQIGNELSLSREGVRLIQNDALKKIKKSLIKN